MRVYNRINEADREVRRRAVSVGGFDGVHRGHQKLLDSLCEVAEELDAVPAAVTFEPIPAQVYSPRDFNNVRLTTARERIRQLEKQCIEAAFILDFDERLRNMTAPEFAEKVLLEQLDTCGVVASETHTFGKDAAADVHRMAEICGELGIAVHIVEPLRIKGDVVNSTQIREYVERGDVEGAAEWLGREYEVSGPVAAGRGTGKKLGFPTANIQPPAEKLLPGDGVYACGAQIDEGGQGDCSWVAAAVSVGTAPTFERGTRMVEAHLLCDDDLRLIGREITLRFLSRLRANRKFGDEGQLVVQIRRDIEQVQEVFGARLPAMN